MFSIIDYMQAMRMPYEDLICGRMYWRLAPHLKCTDGFMISVQAGEMNYCSPREYNAWWHMFEVGYPSRIEPTLLEYAEDAARPCETVYGWVPAGVIDAIVESHGGICYEFPGMRFVLERVDHTRTMEAYPKHSWEVADDN